MLVSISLYAEVSGYVEMSKNDMIDQLQMTLMVEKEIIDNLYFGGTFTNYTLQQPTDKFPVGFVPQSLFYDIHVRYVYGNIEFRFNSICHHNFIQKKIDYPDRDYGGIKFSARYNF